MDALLVFPDSETAVLFGNAMGFTQGDPGDATTTLASHHHAIHIIGEHFVPTGETITDEFGTRPVMAGDGKWWVLFRCPADMEIPPAAEPFLVWSSHEVDLEGNPISRPSNPLTPSTFWS